MIAYTPRAIGQVAALIEFYEVRQRDDAVRAFRAALLEAERKIERNPAAGLAVPSPYPNIARAGQAWVKAGRYWVAYSTPAPPVIVAVFFESADIPNRL